MQSLKMIRTAISRKVDQDNGLKKCTSHVAVEMIHAMHFGMNFVKTMVNQMVVKQK